MLLGEVARRLALAGAGARRPGRDDRLRALDHRVDGSEQHEVGPAGERPAGLVHDELVGDVAVGEDDAVDLLAREDLLELLLGDDRDPLGVERAGQLRRVAPILDAGDLRRRDGDDLHRGVVAIDDVEVVEVAPGGPHDHDLQAVHGSSVLQAIAGNARARAGWCARARRRRRRRTSRFPTRARRSSSPPSVAAASSAGEGPGGPAGRSVRGRAGRRRYRSRNGPPWPGITTSTPPSKRRRRPASTSAWSQASGSTSGVRSPRHHRWVRA